MAAGYGCNVSWVTALWTLRFRAYWQAIATSTIWCKAVPCSADH
jgi:hypothetical protein